MLPRIDFDGYGMSDIGVYRNGTWFIRRSSDGGLKAIEWGGAPRIFPCRETTMGMARLNIALYRDGTWFLKRSSDEGLTTIVWGGAPQDIPLK